MSEQNIYKLNGFDSRDEYLKDLADQFGIKLSMVKSIAVMLGPSEDFDGLLTTLEDYSGSY